jgi:protein-L-isoaspartate(D-aspartate) O-methyltransferase
MDKSDDRWKSRRLRMVEFQIEARGVRNPRVLEAMRTVPRHLFVPETYREAAYNDSPLPIGHGQTISQPYIVAVMTELLELDAGDKVLEIGGGSGYQAAILATLAKEVVTIERIPEVARTARENLRAAGISNVEVVVADGTEGYAQSAPYNAIIVTAATPDIPKPLIEQLADGGRLVAPTGGRDLQTLVKLVKSGETITRSSHGGVVFVPLLGHYGWPE